MERRRLWWPVAGGSSTVIWERVALLAIPSTRENHRSVLVVNCDKRRGCKSDRSDRLTLTELFGLGQREVTLKAMAQGSQSMVSKPVGVRIAWCVSVGFQDGFRGRNLAGLQPSRPHCRMPWSNDRSYRKYNDTRSKGREGKSTR